MADHCQSPCPAIFLAAKTETGVKVCEVVDEFVEWITVVLQRGGNRQTIAVREKADYLATCRRHADGIDETETPPEQRGAGRHRQCTAGLNQRAFGAISMEDITLDGSPQGD